MQKCLAFFPGVDRTLDGLRGPDRGAGVPAEQRRARHLRCRFLRASARLWEALSPDPSSAPTRRTTAGWPRCTSRCSRRAAHGKLALACAGREDDRADPPERPCRCGARRPRDAGAGRRAARSGHGLARPEERPRRSRSRSAHACASTWATPRFRALSERLDALKETHERGC